ncbi:hypothetical protein BO85DRAFT_196869 [Aspergillus piperis CBS 112811]|uniref:CENP-V/GFA domain-containing protein n=1 Tax=Aspergillus piperis CBS 112811 TaxID=1448313 RepID=A0A8G1RB15_9EURO|nr:hypothetical protein BO85DRAFT_196869 [Aspergillus piperis CBS 112811]RAH61454.1 hypothetical protein BO85DRAFT_196869 [Aspergillus piperis CBS 112811]
MSLLDNFAFIACLSLTSPILCQTTYPGLSNPTNQPTNPMTSTPDTVEYKGTCHCGRFQFKLRLFRPLEAVHACHCTLCAKKGYLWLFPAEQEFQVTRGAGELVCYDSSNGGHEEHMFCPTCGTGLSVRGHQMPSGEVGMGVNVSDLISMFPGDVMY